MNDFWLCFIPLFVAVDPLGGIPFFMGVTEGIEKSRLQSLAIKSSITATVVSLLFLLVGNRFLRVLGITMSDFMIAGGVLLFCISVMDILHVSSREKALTPEELGVFPIAVPYMVGPAVFTTGLLLIGQYGFFMTSITLILNLLIVGTGLWFSGNLNRIVGHDLSKIISKLASLLLAAYAVMMVRKGIVLFAG